MAVMELGMKNRSRMEIYYDIVSATKPTARKTHLMYKSNLSFKQLDLYLNTLIESGLIEERIDDKVGRVYNVTKRGLNFLSLFERIASFFSDPKREGQSQSPDIHFEKERGVRVIEEQAFQY